jgi:hypothetical protein
MKKIAFIPSRENLPPPHLSEYLQNAGWQVCLLSGYSSIFEAYSDAITLHDIKAKDKVIMCHDDIDIMTDKKYFNMFIDEKLDNSDTGFVGVAGTCLLKHSGVWWEGLNQPPGHLNPLSGLVYHGKPGTMRETYYGTCGQVSVLDGVFLATTGRVLHTISLKKPKFFTGDWDFYDIFYTAQTYLKDLKNYTIPISLIHNSPGDTRGRDSWHENKNAFIRHFSDKLPFSVT